MSSRRFVGTLPLVTVEQLAAVLAPVLKGEKGQKALPAPSPSMLLRLVRWIRITQRQVNAEREYGKPQADLMAASERALTTLTATLGDLAASLRSAIAADPALLHDVETRLALAEQLLNRPFPVFVPSHEPKFETYLLRFAGEFEIAFGSDGRSFGISDTGPLPRYIAAIHPLVFGSKVAVRTVAKALKQARASGAFAGISHRVPAAGIFDRTKIPDTTRVESSGKSASPVEDVAGHVELQETSR